METSSADTGSSATTSLGLRASARAMAIRCLWPPENSCGIPGQMLVAQADRLDEGAHAQPALLRAAHPVDDERLLQRRRNGLAGVERRVRVLVDDLHVPAEAPQVPGFQAKDVHFGRRAAPVLAVGVEEDLARRRLLEPQDRASRSGLSAAALPYQSQGLPFADCEAHIVDGLDQTRAPCHIPCAVRSTCGGS